MGWGRGYTGWYSYHALRHRVRISVVLIFICATQGCSCHIWHTRHCNDLSASPNGLQTGNSFLNISSGLTLLWGLRLFVITAGYRPFRRTYCLHPQSLLPSPKVGHYLQNCTVSRHHNMKTSSRTRFSLHISNNF